MSGIQMLTLKAINHGLVPYKNESKPPEIKIIITEIIESSKLGLVLIADITSPVKTAINKYMPSLSLIGKSFIMNSLR